MENAVEGYRLREIRKSLGVTQVEMAKRLGVTQNRISRIERGDTEHIQIDTVRRYVEALGGRFNTVAIFENEEVLIA